MAVQAHVDMLAAGVDAWNAWRRDHPGLVPDLSGADLRRVDCFAADLSRARLARANLVGQVLSLADLSGADLREASLLDARLVEVRLGGADLRAAVLSRARIVDAELAGADLRGADLSYASLIRVNLAGARLGGCQVYGIGAWDLVLDVATEQQGLVLTRPEEARVTVDDIELGQLIHLLLSHDKLRNVVNAVARSAVLLLGRFDHGGLELLRALGEGLRTAGYMPVIFDFARPDSRNYTETVKTLAGLSRFVVAELSGPSVPQELYATVPHFKIPFVPLLRRGAQSYGMFADLLEYPWVLAPVRYADRDELLRVLAEQVLAPAELRLAERQALLRRLFVVDETPARPGTR